MDFRFTPEEDAYRDEVRRFIDEEMPEDLALAGAQGDATDPGLAGRVRALRMKIGARGWIAMSWPREYGGQDRPLTYQAILREEMSYARCPGIDPQAYQLGPALIVHGTEAQKREHIGRIASGESRWCQGFSEPNAGSDLASLQTRAEQDGDDFVINGQKIWTSSAHNADYIHLLARTDPDAPKHRGISYFLFPMKSPGVTVKPIRQMDNGQGFNEVYFDNVRVPRDGLFGELHRGWYVATTTLDFERSNVASMAGYRRDFDDLMAYLAGDAFGRTLLAGSTVRHKLADMAVQIQVSRMLSYRVIGMQARGEVPNMEASLAKVFAVEVRSNVSLASMEIMGLFGQLDPAGGRAIPMGGAVERSYLRSACKVGGGSQEIQRNIIAQRGLGLPR